MGRMLKYLLALLLLVAMLPTRASATSYFISPTGSDSNNGLSSGAPWLTPNHALNCGDVINAAAGTYSESNFRIGQWGTVTCAANNDVAWLKCSTFDTCKINIGTAGNDAMDPGKSYWGIQGWEVHASTPSTNQCFNVFSGSGVKVHHVIFANNVANGCGDGGVTSGSASSTVGTDYIAMVGNIAYNAAQDNAHCYSGFDVVIPVNFDSAPGTHIYIAGNYAFDNVDPNPCQGGLPTDGNGVLLDTLDAAPYTGQIVVENNIAVYNGGFGIETFSNIAGGASRATVIQRHNTAYGNETGGTNVFPCSEIGEHLTFATSSTLNIGETAVSTACNPGGSGAVSMYGAGVDYVDSSDTVANNWLFSASGFNTLWGGNSVGAGGFTFGTNQTGTSAAFANPVNPGAPNCSGRSNVRDCMSTVIANFTPSTIAAKAYGYQSPGGSSFDPLFPQWLCSVTNFPAGLIQMGCAGNGAGQAVGNTLPPISAAALAGAYGTGQLGQSTIVTDVASNCAQGTAPASNPGSHINCRIASSGTGWNEVVAPTPTPTPTGTPTPTPTATPTPGGNTFSVANACNTSARATGGCTFNGVTYGAGGTPIPTLTSPTTVTCLGPNGGGACTNASTSGDAALISAALGSGGTSGAHKQVLIQGACCITSTVFIPPFTDIQGKTSAATINNPYGTSSTCNNGPSGQPSFQINGPSQGGTLGHDITISNLTFNGNNVIPPFYPGRTGNSGAACSSTTMAVLIEHASNITIEDNLFLNCTGQACVEALGGGGATPDNSNVVQNWNTYDNCALYGPDNDNVTNAPTNHNYALDCQFGNELDNPTQTGSYTVNYNYSRRRTSFGYNIDWVCTDTTHNPGPSTLTFYCATQNPSSCQMVGNILDATGSALTCTSFGSTQGQFNLSGGHNGNGNLGMSASQNYCYNGSCGCGGGIGGGCIIATPPNPAPSGP